MRAVIILFALMGLAIAAPKPQQDYSQVQIVTSSAEVLAPESYHYNYQLSDQSEARQSGMIVNPQEPDQEKRSLAVQGEYSYTGTDGIPVRVTYTADENGYHPMVYINGVLQNPPQK
ncbi:unnamed protein product [Allacma fusca]|uniref:Uncharacterized protein n=1 Tax=Allacma fusca TaxID=39272 RepID=A0A8J2JT97_9HEXA|nr:unnamed protein product [Allacma fusca]